MSCTICQFTYCWVCGMEEGTLHTIMGGDFMCGLMIVVNTLPTWLSFILHILGFIFLPVVVVICSFAGAGTLAFVCLEATWECGDHWFCKLMWLLICLPFGIASFGIMCCVFIALGTPAAYISFILISFRKVFCIWLPSCCCCKRKRNKVTK
jgi:hypothetical protein